MYPQLKISKQKIFENVKAIVSRAHNSGIQVTSINKVTGGHPEIAKLLLEAGVDAIGDSRIHNLKKIATLDCKKWLIRIPMPSETADVAKYTTLSLNSEMKTILKLNDEAGALNKKHQILYMFDLGDLREGLFIGDGRKTGKENQDLIENNFKKLDQDLKTIKGLTNISLKGVATNATCVGATIPTPETFGAFKNAIDIIENRHHLPVEIVSGGNSSAWYLVENNKLPAYINNLRLGEVLLLGRESAYHQCYDYLNQDAFILDVEIIEILDKPTYPLGEIGYNAFGEIPEFTDKGIRRRAICALGRQDTDTDHIFPLLPGITIEGSSSDHLVLDITDSRENLQVGDILSFRCDYAGTLHAATTAYIEQLLQ